MSRNYEQMLQDALHQRRVNEHSATPDDFFHVDEEEYRILCMQSYDPFINKREATGAPEEICGLLINRSKLI